MLAEHQHNKEVQSATAAVRRSLCLASVPLGQVLEGLEHAETGLMSLDDYTDNRAYEELLVSTSHFCYLLGKANRYVEIASKMSILSSTRGNIQGSLRSASVDAIICLKYGIGSTAACLSKLEDALDAFRCLADTSKLDTIVSSTVRACLRRDVDEMRDAISKLCDFPPNSMFSVSYATLLLHMLVSLIYKSMHPDQERGIPNSTSYVSIQSEASDRENQVDDIDGIHLSVIDTPITPASMLPSLWSDLQRVLSYLKKLSKTFPSGRPTYYRYCAYVGLLKGKRSYTKKMLLRAYDQAREFNINFEIAAVLYDLQTYFMADISRMQSIPTLESAISLIEHPDPMQLLQRYRFIV